jgi:hypothetical protein
MFSLNLGYYLGIGTTFNDLNGVVQQAGSNYSHRYLENGDHSRVLFDPQLYLSALDVEEAKKVCARLSSYSWFQIEGVPQKDDYTKIKDWQEAVVEFVETNWTGAVPTDINQACEDCINFQIDINCSHIILPSPLITERENEGTIQTEWLDCALEILNDLEPTQPSLATIAIDEGALSTNSFNRGGFLDTIIDQYSSRIEDISGVYIVINQTHARHPYETSKLVNKAYLYLAKKFSQLGTTNIYINYADLFGIACCAFGANSFITGKSQSLRRLSMKGMSDAGGGVALPHYYSHKSFSEYLSETELDKIIAKKLFRRIKDDTAFSTSLHAAIQSGHTAAIVPKWAENQSNIAVSTSHFISRLIKEGANLDLIGTTPDILKDEFTDGDVEQTYLQTKIGPNFPVKSAPLADWISIIEEIEAL